MAFFLPRKLISKISRFWRCKIYLAIAYIYKGAVLKCTFTFFFFITPVPFSYLLSTPTPENEKFLGVKEKRNKRSLWILFHLQDKTVILWPILGFWSFLFHIFIYHSLEETSKGLVSCLAPGRYLVSDCCSIAWFLADWISQGALASGNRVWTYLTKTIQFYLIT